MLPLRLIAVALMLMSLAACKPDAAETATPVAAVVSGSTDGAAPAPAASVAGASNATVAEAASAGSAAAATPLTPAPATTAAATTAATTAAATTTAATTAATVASPTAGAVPAAVPSAAPGEFRIVSVLLGNAVDADNLVVSEPASFGRKDAIYASVLSSGRSQGLRISARWMAPGGSTIAETSQPLVPTAATVTTFSVRNPKGWPEGEYQVLIGINGHAQLKKSFTVRR